MQAVLAQNRGNIEKVAISSSRPHTLGWHAYDPVRSRLPPRSVFEAERHWSSNLSHCDVRCSSCAGNALTDFGSFPPTGSCGSGFTECGRRSSKPWYSSNRRLWSSGSQRLSDLLAMAITLSRTAQDERRNTRPDPSNERRQPALGRTSRPRRTAQAWHRRQSGYRWKVSASAPQGSPRLGGAFCGTI